MYVLTVSLLATYLVSYIVSYAYVAIGSIGINIYLINPIWMHYVYLAYMAI